MAETTRNAAMGRRAKVAASAVAVYGLLAIAWAVGWQWLTVHVSEQKSETAYVRSRLASFDGDSDDDVLVIASFREAQLDHVRVGRSARVVIDRYPEARIRGVVDGLCSGSCPDNYKGQAATLAVTVKPLSARILLTEIPKGIHLDAGMSASVTLGAGPEEIASWALWP